MVEDHGIRGRPRNAALRRHETARASSPPTTRLLDEARRAPRTAESCERLRTQRSTVFFVLDGMWCASCAKVAERVLQKGRGVFDAQVSFAAGKGRIDFDPQITDIDDLMRRVTKLGYSPKIIGDADSESSSAHEERLLIQVLVAFAFGMQTMVLYVVRLYPAYSVGDAVSSQVRAVQVLVRDPRHAGAVLRWLTFLRGALTS